MDIVSEEKEIDANKKQRRTGVLLVHGLTGTPTEMKPLEKYLQRAGLDTENVLLAGHGAGSAEIIASSYKDWIESVRQSLAKLLERNDRAIICGLSMGALLACEAALSESRVSGLVLMSPTLRYDGSVLDDSIIDWIWGSSLTRQVMKSMVKTFPFLGEKFYWEELPPYGIRDERIQRQITKSIEASKAGGGNEFGVFRTYYGPLAQMMDLVDRVQRGFAKLKCPVLLMHSLDDTIASIHNASETYLKVGSNNKALFLISGCDHVMTLDLQRSLVHKTIGRFVEAYSGILQENRSVRSIVAPVLSETKFAKGGSLSALISPEMHGLNKDEWKLLYPTRRFAHLASISDVQQLHSIVLRDQGQVVLSLPVFIGAYQQDLALRRRKGWTGLLRAMLAPDVSVFGVGSLISELPGLGLNKASTNEAQAKSYAQLIRIVDSMARSHKVDAFSNTQQHVPELPEPAAIHRANDKRAIKLCPRVRDLIAGKSDFLHRNFVSDHFSRFIRVAVPQHDEAEPAAHNARAQGVS